jgi:hypothetical protein
VLNDRVEREVAANSATNRHDFLVALEAAEKQSHELAVDDGDGPQRGSNASSLGVGLR